MQPNVVLIVLDTARADAFEPYGAPAGTTPVTADLARRGQAWTMRSTANWTVPAHASMFTGLLPRDLGLTQVAGGDRRRCRAPMAAAADRNLVPWLQAAGWDTRAVSANPWVSAESGFGVGFDEFVVVPTPRRARMHDPSTRSRVRWAVHGMLARADHGVREVDAVLDGWLRDRTRNARPFFWFINLLECHSPYLPPKPFNDLPAWRRLQAAEEARRYLNLENVFRVCAGNRTVPGAALARMRHLYLCCIRLLDDWLGRFLERLDLAGLLADTEIVLTSDHGENLGDAGLIGHAFSLDERLLRVPFVTAGPLSLTSSGLPLMLSDLPALLAGALSPQQSRWPAPADRVTVAQHDGLAEPESAEMRAVRGLWGLDEQQTHRLTRALTAACDGRWKLVGEDDREAVAFDLSADPGEQAPLAAAAIPEDVHTRLSAALQEAMTASGAAAAVAPVDAVAPGIDQTALEEQMRMLGYL